MRYQFSLKEIDSRKVNNAELFYYGMFWNFVHSVTAETLNVHSRKN